jgi:prolyl-tRNA editing enzyme YbaK/EbsC (Cys-tRNA(Pro) deacylase)
MAADEIGCHLGQIAKSILFLIDGAPVMVIASGNQRIDDRKLATLLGVSRKKVRTATAENCIEITGYAPGGVPPLGHRRDDIRIFIEDSLGRYETIYAAAGAHNAIMPMAFTTLVALSNGTLADLRREIDPSAPA